jgi:hypothetical protein
MAQSLVGNGSADCSSSTIEKSRESLRRNIGTRRGQPSWVRHLVYERLHDLELLCVLMEGTTRAAYRLLSENSSLRLRPPLMIDV